MLETDVQAAPECEATGCTRPAAGGQLCATDERRLGDWLAQLGAEYEQLAATPSLQGREPGTGGGGSLASHRSPALLDVLVLRDPRSRERDLEDADGNRGRSVAEVLLTYGQLVREQRDLTVPTVDLAYVRAARPLGPVCDPYRPPCGHHTCEVWTFRATVTPRPTVLSERKVLSDHLPWIVGQDWAGEFFDEIRALWGLLRSANGHASGARRTVCREAGCSGTVRWVDGAAVCSSCGATTSGPELLRVAAEKEAA